MEIDQEIKTTKDGFLEDLFDNKLADPKKFDPVIVDLIKTHLSQTSIPTKAGKNLAAELIKLADERSQGE